MILGATAAGFALLLLRTRKSLFLEWDFLAVGGLELEIAWVLDPIRLLFFASVSWIAAAVISFAKSYISGERFYLRFTLLVLRFVASIFILIFRPNLVSILLGWDGLGVTSYLLVIYYQRRRSYNAGLLTALTNRLGDVGILLSIALLASAGSWNFGLTGLEVTTLAAQAIVVVLTLAAITKRAQIPFAAWLPAAIAAPTPVSALVHSSTLVTAGVYLLIRFNKILACRPYLVFLLFSGAITILIAGLRAMFEMDIKKMVALSTLSQLGLIMRSLGIGAPQIAFFHLLSHAYFKALLFICAGNLIHCRNDFQDLRQMGASYRTLPLTTSFINLSNLRLCGFPFIAGFYSKDIFLEIRLIGRYSLIAVFLFFGATLLTAAYSVRFTYLTSVRPSRGLALLWASDEDRVIIRGNFLLFPLAVGGGRALSWALFPTPGLILLPLTWKTLALTVRLAGVLIGLGNQTSSHPAIRVLALMWNLPLIRSRTTSPGFLLSGSLLRTGGDLGWFFSTYHSLRLARGHQLSSSTQAKLGSQFTAFMLLGVVWALLGSCYSLLWLLYVRIPVLNWLSPLKSKFSVRYTLG